MVTVKETLLKCDVERLADVYVKLLSEDANIEMERILFCQWYHEILKAEGKKNEEYIIVPYMACQNGRHFLDTGVIMPDEIKSKKEFTDDEKDVAEKMQQVADDWEGTEELKKELSNSAKAFWGIKDLPEPYAYDLDEPEEVLFYMLPESLLELYGIEDVMAQIAYEMTFFGYGKEGEEGRGSVKDSIDNFREEDADTHFKILDIDELKSMDKRSEEEREKDWFIMSISIYITRLRFAQAAYKALEGKGVGEVG